MLDEFQQVKSNQAVMNQELSEKFDQSMFFLSSLVKSMVEQFLKESGDVLYNFESRNMMLKATIIDSSNIIMMKVDKGLDILLKKHKKRENSNMTMLGYEECLDRKLSAQSTELSN
jgi:dipeptidase